MRARYYNVTIKRFINRDIITGDISNTQSLNRYCYVQGNPINLLDPFGLSQSSDDGSGGDHLMGSLSLVSALPAVGSFLGNGAKVVAKTTKVASKGGKVVNKVNKAADAVKSGSKLISHSTDLTTTAIDIGYGVSDLYQEIKSGNGLRKILNKSGSGTVTAHTSAGIKNTGSPEVSDNKAQVQVGGESNADSYVTPEGSVIPQSMYHSLSDIEARKWYLAQEAKIPDMIDYNQLLEQQAYQAFFFA